MLFKKFTPYLLSSTLILSANAFADDEIFDEGYAQFRIGGGVTWLQAKDSNIGITSKTYGFTEVDTLTSSSSDHAGAVATIGAGYVLPFEKDDPDEEFLYLPGLIVSIDATYQFENDLTGDVYDYGDPEFDNYNYTYGIQNTNLLANFTLGLLEYERWTLFGIAGLGIAWTWVEYSETPKPGVPKGNLTLDTGSQTTFAWQGGGGIGYELFPELDLTLTYLYTDLGKVETSSNIVSENNLNGDSYISTTPAFDLHEQSVVLGLQWNFL